MPSTIRISSTLQLPIEAVTQTFGIIAKRGVGKSYTAGVMAEEFLKNRLHTVVMDPIGVWWGLRASADGRKEGLPIVIMGGEHGDVPIEPGSGEVIANAIIDQRISAVVDTSLFRKGEQKRFVTDFAETLYRRNRAPLHMFLDEADAFAPQRPMKGEERMLGSIEDIVRRGRARGLGVTLITQRTAVLNKDVLTQVEVLILLRTIAPQDRDAAKAWVRVHADEDAWRAMEKDLTQLPVGTAYVWSPGWLDICKKVKIRLKETFDSSKTPEVGQKVQEPQKLAQVDLAKLREQIAGTIEKAKKEDVKYLLAEIQKLQAELAAERKRKPQVQAAQPKAVVQKVEVPVLSPKDLLGFERAADKLAISAKAMGDAAANVRGHADMIRHRLEVFDRQAKQQAEIRPVQVIRTREGFRGHVVMPKPPQEAPTGSVKLRKGEKEILQALWWLGGSGTMAKVGMLAGFPPNGSTFTTYLGVLKRHQLVNVISDLIDILPAGEAAVPDKSRPKLEGAELLGLWKVRLRAGERRVLDVLINNKGSWLRFHDVMQASEIVSESTFTTYVGVLKRLGLAKVNSNGDGTCTVAASEEILGS